MSKKPTKKTNTKKKKSAKKTPQKGKQVQIKLKMKKPNLFNNIFFYVLLLIAFFALTSPSSEFGMAPEKRSIGEVVNLINEEKVQDIVVAGDKVEVLLRDGTPITTEKESNISFDEILSNNSVDRSKIAGELRVEHRITFEQVLTPIIMFGLPVLVIFFIFKQMKGQSSEVFSFGKSKAKRFDKGASKTTFKDVAGVEEAKREMMEIVDFLKRPEKYRKLGARIPKGVLLVGPAGVGKTLLAKAIAGEAGVPFFSAAGSEFMEMLVGVGSSRVRDLFNMARQSQPSLIFIDEIDAIGRQRGMGIGGGHDEREQTLNQILIEMDGFDTRTDVIVLAATNRPDMLDPALVRPGRFDRTITVPLPDLKDREEIIKLHMNGKPIAKDISIDSLAKKTVGFSGADIENMLNEAAILAARADKTEIDDGDLDEASLKVTMGSERRTMQSEEERKMTAYHEAGHAMVANYLPDMDAVNRISIVARGASLGHTSFPPERDRYNETQTRLLSIISAMLGGRAAEEVVFNELTIGASDDIKRASELARKMVMKYGMSPLGPINYVSEGHGSWLAKETVEGLKLSENLISKIDKEVENIMDTAYTKAKNTLVKYRSNLDSVANKLLEKETIDGDEFRSLLA